MKIKTSVEKVPRSPKNKEQRHKAFSKEDLTEAVKKAFEWTKGRIDARFLWSDCGVHRFRANCWDDVMIQHSEFVYVIEEDNKLTVKRETYDR